MAIAKIRLDAVSHGRSSQLPLFTLRLIYLSGNPAKYLQQQRTVAKRVCDYSGPRILSMLRHECQSASGGK